MHDTDLCCEILQEVVVGQYGKKYDDYRMITAVDVANAAFRARLLSSHQIDNSWKVLDCFCEMFLHIADGFLIVSECDSVALMGLVLLRAIMPEHVITDSHSDRYSAMTWNKKWRVWNETPPKIDVHWGAKPSPDCWDLKAKIPCLFLRRSADELKQLARLEEICRTCPVRYI